MAHEVIQGCEELTAQAREVLRSKIGSERFDLWLTPETLWDLDLQTLTLTFASDFARQLCRNALGSEISQILREFLKRENFDIRFEVNREPKVLAKPAESSSAERSKKPEHGSDRVLSKQLSADVSLTGTSTDIAKPQLPSSETDAFQNIILGDSNQMAVAAIRMAATDPGRLSPICLHGPSGCGKSMLLSAVAHHLRGNLRLRRVVMMTSEQFTNDFTEGLRGGGLPMFRRKYRDVEALLLDDLQFFAGKRSTLAEVRHTIDNLIRAGKQVVVSLDRPLSDLPQLGEELLGRLRGGLVTPLFPLDPGIRLRLMKQLTHEAGIQLEDGVVEQLAERLAGDGRLIRGVFHRLMAVASLHKERLGRERLGRERLGRERLSWDRTWSAVCDLIQANQPVVRLADIERTVCGMFGLEQDSLQSPSKTRFISQPRMLAMYLARRYTPAAYKEIGDYFGKRRHSTVISAEKTVESWLEQNAQLDGPRQLSIQDAIRQVKAQLQVG